MAKFDADQDKVMKAWEKAEASHNTAKIEQYRLQSERMMGDHRRLLGREINAVSTLDHTRRHLALLKTEGEYERRLELALEHERLWTGGG